MPTKEEMQDETNTPLNIGKLNLNQVAGFGILINPFNQLLEI